MQKIISFIVFILIMITLIQPIGIYSVHQSFMGNKYRTSLTVDTANKYLKEYLNLTSLNLFNFEDDETDANYGLILLQPKKYGEGVVSVFDTNAIRTGGFFDLNVKVTIKKIDNNNIRFKVVVTFPYVDSIKGWKVFNEDLNTLHNKTVVVIDTNTEKITSSISLRDLNLYYGFVIYPDINSEDSTYTNQYPIVNVSYVLEPVKNPEVQPVKLLIDGRKETVESKYASELLEPYKGANLWSKVKNKLLTSLVNALNDDIDNKLKCYNHHVSVSFDLADFDISPIDIRIESDKHIISMIFTGEFSWHAVCKYYVDGNYQGSTTIGSYTGTISRTISNSNSDDNIHGLYGGYTFQYLTEVSATNLVGDVIPSYSLQSERRITDGPLTNDQPTSYTFVPYVGGVSDVLYGQDLSLMNYSRAYVVLLENSPEDPDKVNYVRKPLQPGQVVNSYSIGLLLANVRGVQDNLFTTGIFNETYTSETTYYFGNDRSWNAIKTGETSWTTTEYKREGNETIIIKHHHLIRATVYAQIKLHGTVKLKEEDVKSILIYKQLYIPHIVFNVMMQDISGWIKYEIERNSKLLPSGFSLNPYSRDEIYVIPALAPLNGSGIPTKLVSFLNELDNSDNSLVSIIGSAITGLTNVYNKYLGGILPVYFPIPCPEELSLNRFIQGEYLGFYAVTPEVKIPEEIDHIPGTPVLTIYAESVTAKYTGAMAVFDPDSFSLRQCTGEECEIYSMSLGIGVGKIGGKTIGSRIYIIPSYSSDAPESNDAIKTLNNAISSLLSKVADISNSLFKFIGNTEVSVFLQDIARDQKRYGSYIQFGVYFSSGNQQQLNPPIAVFITPKTNWRFIVGSSGILSVKANLHILYIKVIKPAFIPAPIVIPIYFEIKSEGNADINVDTIKILPMSISYDHLIGNDTHLSDIHCIEDMLYHFKNKRIYIYAVPVWNDTGEPVLLRGSYGNSSMILEAIYGKRISYVNISDLGFPLSPIKLEYSVLYGLSNITLIVGWRISKRITLEKMPSGLLKEYIINITRLHAWILDLDKHEATMYIGKISDLITEEHGELVENLYNNVSDLNDKFLSIKTLLEDKMNILIDRIRPEESFNELLEQISSQLYDLIYSVVLNIATNIGKEFLSDIVGIILDPTGGIIYSYISKFVKHLMDNVITPSLNQIKQEIFDFIKSTVFTILDWMVRSLIAETMEEYMKPMIINYINNTLDMFYELFGKNETLDLLLSNINILFISQYTLKTRMSLLNTVYYVALNCSENGMIKNSDLGIPYHLSFSRIKLPKSIKNSGGFLIIESTNLINVFASNLFGKISENQNATVCIDVGNLLNYIKGWIDYVIKLGPSESFEELSDMAEALEELSNTYHQLVKDISYYMVVNGLSTNEIILPAIVYIPPTQIG